jgi:hypothetical protein
MTEDEKREIVRKGYDTLDRTLRYTEPVERDLLQEFTDKRRRREERKAQRERRRWEREAVTKPYTPAVVKAEHSNGQEQDWSEWNAWAEAHVQRGIAAHQEFQEEVLGEVIAQIRHEIDGQTRGYVGEVKSQVTALGAKIETLRERQMLERTNEMHERNLDIRGIQLAVEQLNRRIDQLEERRESDLKEATFRIAAWLGNFGNGH